MSGFLAVLLGVFVAAYAILGLIVWRQPLVGRLALREVVRRPIQTAILIVGLTVGGASIFSVQVALDSGTAYVTANDLATWGRDDIEITAGGGTFDPGLAARLSADPVLAQNLAATQNAVTLTTSVTDLNRNLGKPGVQLIGVDLASQERFGAFVLSDGRRSNGAELTTGRVFISKLLADALGARVGDRLQVGGAGNAGAGDFVVAGILRRSEAGAYGEPRSIFGSLTTAQRVAGTSDVNLVRISARGDGDAEIERARQMVAHLQSSTGGGGLLVLETKRLILAVDAANSSWIRTSFTTLGLVVVLAASAVVINLAVMLAEERRPRLAMLRALGLTRAGLVKVAVVEGAIYSLAGSLVGIPVGLVIGLVMNSYLHYLTVDGSAVQLSLEPSSLLGSIAAASVITLLTLFITSLRTSRMAISAAIRDLPEPAQQRRVSVTRLVLLASGVLIGAALILWGGAAERVVGGAVVIACAGGLARGRLSERVRFTAIGASVAAWAIGYVSLTVKTWVVTDQTFGAVMGILVAVIGISVLAASQLRLLEYLATIPGGAAASLRTTLRPALAYTSRRPLRSGLVIAALALIIAIFTVLAGGVTQPNYARDSGGFDVRATEVGSSQVTLPPDVQRNIGRQETIRSRAFLGPVRVVSNQPLTNNEWMVQPVTVFGLTDQQLASGMMPIHWDARYHSAAEAWQAVANDPKLVVGGGSLGSVGDEVDLATANGTLRLTVVAVEGFGAANPPIIDGFMASQKLLESLTASPPGAMLLLTAAAGVAPRALADQVQRAMLSEGGDATTMRQILDDQYAGGQALIDLLLILMRVGLLVGVFSLGTIALRAVVERRRAIGVLRAIGFRPDQVLFGMIIETVLMTTVGVAVGLGAAYSLGGIVLTGNANGAFVPEMGTLLPAVGVMYATVLLVTVLPAIRASRLRPAEALRTVA